MRRTVAGPGGARSWLAKRGGLVLPVIVLVLGLAAAVRWGGYLPWVPIALAVVALWRDWRNRKDAEQRELIAAHIRDYERAPVIRDPGAFQRLPDPLSPPDRAPREVGASEYGALFDRLTTVNFVALDEHGFAHHARALRDFGAVVPSEPALLPFYDKALPYLRVKYAAEVRQATLHALTFQRADPGLLQTMHAEILREHALVVQAQDDLGRASATLQEEAPELAPLLGPLAKFLAWKGGNKPVGKE